MNDKRTTRLCIITTVPVTIQAFWGKQLDFLHENGFEITVITSPDEKFRQFLPKHVHYEPVPITRVVTPWSDLVSLLRVYRVFRRNKFDIAQCATLKAALFGSISGWLAHIPVRLYLMWGLNYATMTGFKRWFFRSLDKMVCTLSTYVCPDSNGNVRFVVKDGLCLAGKIGVIGHGSANSVDLERFNPDALVEAGKETAHPDSFHFYL
jgi:hypothetical protein